MAAVHELDTVVLDETATPPRHPKPSPTSTPPTAATSGNLLTPVAADVADSEDPSAAAITAGARQRNPDVPHAADLASITREGARATIAGRTARAGARALPADAGSDTSELDQPASSRREEDEKSAWR
ncbi:hypothetical protein ACL03H_01145 [Saccharopolyspora sp. MS10]|uniref:hypothetical protein n=1 Tax=Saccharopolyspora sp. MS10 TaxID=3385973 RepID=UPI00399F3B88